MNREAISNEVLWRLIQDAPDFDVYEIVEDIGFTYGYDLTTFAGIPDEEFWAIVERHRLPPLPNGARRTRPTW
ncbi:hypothetical protein GCM10009733_020300 [Nonomuraea maheshkhaliensis]|uniref:Uncharacterized protein n=1 Tax=Nonomuraea maheshkhaliensis TaxID=419590 RepID=A0ABP4QVS7_9ACTN